MKEMIIPPGGTARGEFATTELMSMFPRLSAGAPGGDERKKSGEEEATLLPFCNGRPAGEDMMG